VNFHPFLKIKMQNSFFVQWLIWPTCLLKAFTDTDTKSIKIQSRRQILLALLGSGLEKAGCKCWCNWPQVWNSVFLSTISSICDWGLVIFLEPILYFTAILGLFICKFVNDTSIFFWSLSISYNEGKLYKNTCSHNIDLANTKTTDKKG